MSPPLKLGVVDQSPVPNGRVARDAVQATLDLARLCDRLGYSRYWLAEHHSTNSFAGSAPEVLIPRVASVTERIRVGSGGVMLPHYSPYKVAEQFRMLQTLLPGRIDLGLGRAPAGTGAAAAALRYGRDGIAVERFPDQIQDLMGWLGESLEEGHPHRRVRATPRGTDLPELWMLGSGGSTAGVAAALGLGYSFAQFISGLDGASAVRAYRDAFRPSPAGTEARANVGVSVICAGTSEEAHRLALSVHLWRMRIIRGVDRGIPSPEQAEAEFGEAGVPLDELRVDPRSIVGDPDEVRAGLLRLAGRYGVDEVMTVTVTHDLEARRRSYELLAEVMELG
ncbi:MAG: LLM class flavin-dependent oxidoreductase [Gemmatimonadetes bacterium]|nr:LLM class flavin-dependent oxidoreductase [Gemmatimonadota bacterium]